MSGSKKNKNQYVEHNEEHVGAEMKPFVVYTVEEQTKENNLNVAAPYTPASTTAITNNRKRRRWWRKVTAFFG